MKAEEILRRYAGKEEQMIIPSNMCLQYEGRIDFEKEEGPLWTYPATSVRIRFQGSALTVVLSNFHAYWDNYLGYLLDGAEHCVRLNESGVSCLKLYTAAGNLTGMNGSFGKSDSCKESDQSEGVKSGSDDGIHELLIFKRQDSCHMVQIHGFIGSADLELLPCEPLPARRIEVYGDSVSAGEVSEAVDYCGEPDPEHNGEYSNSFYSYAWLTARRLGARLHNIAQGGIALMDGTGYFMEPNQQGMETIFDKIQYQPYLLENSEYLLGQEIGETDGEEQAEKSTHASRGAVKWDFNKYRPQVVIVAVGQNDAYPVDFCAGDYEGVQACEWRKRYAAFIRKLRKIHPQAQIICMTTILGHHENWDRSIEEVCASLNDSKVHHFLFAKNGCGTRGHIRRPEAEKMAEELSAYINSLGENIWRDTVRLEDAMNRAAHGEALTLGFMGGSITQGSLASSPETCYASLVTKWWKETFPQARITSVNAGIGGTTSHFGAARVEEDLLRERPDVVFVEFSVNDDDTAHFQETYEGLVRRILNCSWKPAVILLHNCFYSDGHSAQQIHDRIGAYYGLPRVCMGDVIYPKIESGVFPMKEVTPDGLHPNDKGHAWLAKLIEEQLEEINTWRMAGCSRDGEGSKVDKGNKGEETVPITLNRYEEAKRLDNRSLVPVYCQGFLADTTLRRSVTDIFKNGWTARQKGAEISFVVEAACIAVQYRRTINKPAPVATVVVDGDEKNTVILDGNFNEAWGDSLALQILLEGSQSQKHTVTIQIVEGENVKTQFYLVSLIVA